MEIKSIQHLTKVVKDDILKTFDEKDIEELSISELIDNDMRNTIEKFALSNYTITDIQFKKLTNSNYGNYNYCDDNKSLIMELVLTVLEYRIVGKKKTFNQIVKEGILSS